MPKDIKREVLTGPRKFDEIMEKLVIINEMMTDDRPVPTDLANVGTHDARTTQSDQDASSDVSYDDVCAIPWKGYRAGKGRKDQTEQGRAIVEKEIINGRVAKGKKGGQKGSKGSKLDWFGDTDKKSRGHIGTGRGKGNS